MQTCSGNYIRFQLENDAKNEFSHYSGEKMPHPTHSIMTKTLFCSMNREKQLFPLFTIMYILLRNNKRIRKYKGKCCEYITRYQVNSTYSYDRGKEIKKKKRRNNGLYREPYTTCHGKYRQVNKERTLVCVRNCLLEERNVTPKVLLPSPYIQGIDCSKTQSQPIAS